MKTFCFPGSSIVFSKLLLVLTVSTVSSQQDGFHNFITEAMRVFGAWMVSTGRDPTSVIPYKINFSSNAALLNVTGYIEDHKFSKISSMTIYPDDIESNLLEGRFKTRIYWEHIIDDAYYHVEGNVMASIPVSGDGLCTLEVAWSYLRGLEFVVKNLGVTPAGYLDLSVANVEYRIDGPTFRPGTRFDGLQAGGFEEDIVRVMFDAFSSQSGQFFPVGEYLKTYFGTLFAETPLSEIISTTPGPPFTTPGYEDTTTTTTERIDPTTNPEIISSSTIDPCSSVGMKIILHNETVLEIDYSHDTHGKKVRTTKKLQLVTIYEEIE